MGSGRGIPGRRVGADQVLSGVCDGFRDNSGDWKAGIDEYPDGAERGDRLRDSRIVHFQQYTDTRPVADALSE